MSIVKVSGFRSWNLNASDLDATARFYRDVLGAEERGSQTIGGARVVRMNAGGVGIGLFDASTGDRPGIPHHTFLIEGPSDPDVLVEQLKAKGCTVDGVRRYQGGIGYSVYVLDPSGNRLELSTGQG